MADQPGRERRRKVAAATNALRDLRVELAVLNHRVGNRVELKDLDFDCLDVAFDIPVDLKCPAANDLESLADDPQIIADY